MAERELFQIGEVARMYHVSVGTLRHYEQAGLLKPEYTDPATGYRYYSVRQLEQLTSIRYLRALDMPLQEIAVYMNDRDVDNVAAALRRQKALIARKKQELEQIERKIDHRLTQLEEARRAELDRIRLEVQPVLRLALVREPVEFHSYLWLERSIRKLEQNQKVPLSYIGKVGVGISQERLQAGDCSGYELVFLVLDEEDVYCGEVLTLPQGQCAVVRFRGSHENAAAHYAALLEYLRENQLELAGFSREMTLIDNCISNDPDPTLQRSASRCGQRNNLSGRGLEAEQTCGIMNIPAFRWELNDTEGVFCNAQRFWKQSVVLSAAGAHHRHLR